MGEDSSNTQQNTSLLSVCSSSSVRGRGEKGQRKREELKDKFLVKFLQLEEEKCLPL